MKVDANRLVEEKDYCKDIFMHYAKQKVLRKAEGSLFAKHINKALSNLEFANFILSEHDESIKEKLPGKSFYDWCITIYYYSIYHAALALLARIGYDSKSHIATIAAITLFYYHQENVLGKDDIEFLIENSTIEKEDVEIVIGSKSLREKACYGVGKSFELSQAEKLQEQTAGFVNKVREVIDK